MNTKPLWGEKKYPAFPKLSGDISCDVLIVGGGIVGITAAYELQKLGIEAVVVERNRIAGGETGHTTAHITHVTDSPLQDLLKHFGPGYTQGVWAAGQAAASGILQNISTESISCGLREVAGYYVPSLHPALQGDEKLVRRQFELALDVCRDTVRLLEKTPLVPQPSVQFHHQHLFHPRDYLAALASRAVEGGARIFEETEALNIDTHAGKAGAGSFHIDYGTLVLATHVPPGGLPETIPALLFQTKLAAYNTYAVGGRIPKGTAEECLYWDTNDPYYHLRIHSGPDSDYVILGGEDHKTGQNTETEGAFERLEMLLKQLFPDATPDHHWSGQVIETVDGMPYIGEAAPHVFLATGFGGNGMTFGTLAGLMISESIATGMNAWADLFDVHRKSLAGVAPFVTENIDFPVHLLRDRLGPAERLNYGRIKENDGTVAVLDGQKVAVFRPAQGAPVLLSAICPHMGCVVSWNAVEHTWDCPCHGSRFNTRGQVINGPAIEPLKQLS